jgi:hypothetical protein
MLFLNRVCLTVALAFKLLAQLLRVFVLPLQHFISAGYGDARLLADATVRQTMLGNNITH